MEKLVLVIIDNKPSFNIAVTKETSIQHIKILLEKYKGYYIKMFINPTTELPVFGTNVYDNVTLESVWNQLQDSTINLRTINLKDLPKDVFREIILSGNIMGKDLIALCGSDSNISNKCNHDNFWIFRKLLEKEFGIKVPKSQINPRNLYVLLNSHRETWRILKTRLEDIEHLNLLQFICLSI